MTITLYHNPNCSKSRATLALLNERGISPTVVVYLDTPPNQEQILALIEKLGPAGGDILRKQQPQYDASGLAGDESDPRRIAAAIAAQPALLQRPIVVNGDKARIGRPPQAVLEIL